MILDAKRVSFWKKKKRDLVMLTFPQCKHDVFLADHPLFFFFDIYIYYLPDLQ